MRSSPITTVSTVFSFTLQTSIVLILGQRGLVTIRGHAMGWRGYIVNVSLVCLVEVRLFRDRVLEGKVCG